MTESQLGAPPVPRMLVVVYVVLNIVLMAGVVTLDRESAPPTGQSDAR